MDVGPALEAVGIQFSKRPLDFFNENDIQSQVYEELRDRLNSKDDLYVEWSPYWKDNPIRLDHNRQYITEGIHHKITDDLDRIRCSHKVGSPISRVHTEVRISQAFIGDISNIVDIAILNQPLNRPLSLDHGKIRVEEEAIDTLIEIKRPRDPLVPMTIPEKEILNSTWSELQSAVDLERLNIEDDIAGLEELAEINTYQNAFLFICSPYDLFRCGQLFTTQSHDYRGKAAIAELQRRCDETAVLYSYPGGSEWVVEP